MDRSLENTPTIENGPTLVQRFNTYFHGISADTPELIKVAFALRYQVYCIERQFEDPALRVDCLESDELDRRSIHSLLVHRPRAEAIGTARLILPLAEPESLPIQRLLRENGFQAGDYFPNDTVAEVSRFAISKEFRRQTFEVPGSPRTPGLSELRSSLPFLGLVQVVLRQSIEMGIDHWAAVMEPQLLRMLAIMGIHFRSMGPLVSHHGLRQPSYCYIPQMLKELEQESTENWAVVSNAGELRYSTTQDAIKRVA